MNWNKRIIALLISVVLMVMQGGTIVSVFAEDSWQVRSMRSEARVFENKDKYEYSIPYRLFKPQNYDASKKYPLMLYLHGVNVYGTDNVSQLTSGAINVPLTTDYNINKYPCFILVPQCPEGEDWEYGTDAPMADTMEAVIEIMGKLQEEFSIDADRLYVTGISKGATAVWDIIYRRPDLFAAAIPIAGWTDPRIASTIYKVPVWTFFAEDDGGYIVSSNRAVVSAMKNLGGKPLINSYPYGGHIIWNTRVYKEPGFFRWIFSQRRKSDANITLQFDDVQSTAKYYDDLSYLCGQGVLEATGSFRPNENTTLLDVIKLLLALDKSESEREIMRGWSEQQYQTEARKKGFITNQSDMSLVLSREEIAGVIYKALDEDEGGIRADRYYNLIKDYQEIKPEYQQAVIDLYLRGIMQLATEEQFKPASNMTRSEFISMLRRLIDVSARVAPIDMDAETKATSVEVIAETNVVLNGERNSVRTKETNMGNLIADAMRAQAGADIALIQGGGIRASIEKGAITYRSIYTVLPFDNTVIAMQVSGADIIAALEHGFSAYPEASAYFLQVSGITVSYNAKAVPGSRVLSVKVGNVPLKKDKKYKLAISDFLASGEDDFSMFTKYPILEQHPTIAEVLCEYVIENGINESSIALGRIGIR